MSARMTLRIVAIVLGVILVLRFLWFAQAIFFVTFLGVLGGLAISPAVDFLERHRVRRGLGAPVMVLLVVAVLVGTFMLIAPSVKTQTRGVTKELPKHIETLKERAPMASTLASTAIKEVRGAGKFLFPAISSVIGAIGGVVVILFIALYIAMEPGVYRKGIEHLIPHDMRDRGQEALDLLRDTLRKWLFARLLAMIVVGTLTGIALGLLKVKGAAALGVLAGLLELIPFFGPMVSAIPAIGMALVDSPQKALGVAGIYLVMQQLEGNVITPLILEKRLDIPPVLTVVTVSAMGMIFGVLGMLVAEPLLAVALVLTKLLYVEGVVGDDVKV